MLKIDELEKELKNGNLASMYLLFGEETFLLENNLKKIKKLFGELVKGINYILLDEESIANIISDIETPAFGYEKKLIIARNTKLFQTKGTKRDGSQNPNRTKRDGFQKSFFQIKHQRQAK